MRNLALKKIQKMKPYKPPIEGRAKYEGLLLDFNERTAPVSEKVIGALKKFVKSKKLQLYPEYSDLERKIAKYSGVNPNQVMVTNGSDQAIDIIFRTFTEKGDKVIIPSPSFQMFYQCSQIIGNKIISSLYRKDDLSFPLKEVINSIDKKVRLIIVCNPNNPTGTAVSLTDIEKIAKKAQNAIIFVDEVYFEFSKITAVPLIEKYPNIIVTRTFSKAFGLASLRIGYVIAKKEYISEILKVRGSYSVNMAAYYAAKAALEDKEGLEDYINEVMKKAKPLVEKFFSENNILYYPSRANFILFRPENPKNVLRTLAKAGVLVREQNQKNIKGFVRVSIGTVKQMKKFIAIYPVRKWLSNGVYKNNVLKNKKYAFLDRDGTLIFEPKDGKIDSLKKLKILPGVIEALKELKKREYKMIMVSNQKGLGTPLFPLKSFEKPQKKMLEIFKKGGMTFEKIFICPHFVQENCNCRKPKTGLVDKFLKENLIDKRKSFVCGDRETDRQFARNIGIKFIPMKTNGNFYQAIKSLLT